MSLSAKLQPHFNSTPLSHQFLLQRFNCFSKRKCSTLFMHNHLCNNTNLFLTLRTKPCSSNTNDNAYELSDSTSHEGSAESEESKKGDSLSINEIMKKLKRYGVSGILSYGLLNTAYYLTTFLFVWFYIAPAPGKMGYLAAVERFLKLMAMVWAGSQVTKLLRAAGALALAPIVDRGLSWFTNKFKFQSQGKAFMAIVGFCFGLALIVFLVITLLWA
ncbi:hypothetical protein MtrunA17_Chr3g0080911 [Medicago truncatula]|uniref:Transmembrane protein, putative n=1 Tax=Medicago truncatula TaxID=3880 RepID=G7ZZF5_MEDTR|nr:uncharacterized protein LOC25488552 isoform X1 [Medicago truncatula]KEH32933.1 transmembrane protein, putative [Medicago truncatula]RHN65533.1 hypothetical protein MtrunA17_Chr3g0080911 [Medicago truncatula]